MQTAHADVKDSSLLQGWWRRQRRLVRGDVRRRRQHQRRGRTGARTLGRRLRTPEPRSRLVLPASVPLSAAQDTEDYEGEYGDSGHH